MPSVAEKLDSLDRMMVDVRTNIVVQALRAAEFWRLGRLEHKFGGQCSKNCLAHTNLASWNSEIWTKEVKLIANRKSKSSNP